MILNNTQANIFKVNGGIADNFANRPAANGSFYIFYSIDTQEIFYDNGAWVLLGSGGGGGVNIYNSDGTLTGNRTLTGANNDLNFADLNVFKTSVGGNDIGLKLDFLATNYFFGDFNATNNGAYLLIQDAARSIELNASNNFNNTRILIDDFNQLITTQLQFNDIGLKLDFANTIYQFGAITGGGQTTFEINDTTQSFTTKQFYSPTNTANVINGIDLNLQSEVYKFGAINGAYGNHHLISDSQNYWFYTRLFGQNRGFFFQVSNLARTYRFGEITTNNRTQITIDDIAETTTFFHAGVQKGLKLDYAQRRYGFGQLSANNLTSFNIEDNGGFIYCLYQNNGIGFSFQGNVSVYQYGQISGGNQTRLTIADAATYPVQVDGTNVLSGTSGGSSGQHLKIKVNGVDYKIRLENP
jgi:hypothetical protein